MKFTLSFYDPDAIRHTGIEDPEALKFLDNLLYIREEIFISIDTEAKTAVVMGGWANIFNTKEQFSTAMNMANQNEFKRHDSHKKEMRAIRKSKLKIVPKSTSREK
jgi:hypothetical protein